MATSDRCGHENPDVAPSRRAFSSRPCVVNVSRTAVLKVPMAMFSSFILPICRSECIHPCPVGHSSLKSGRRGIRQKVTEGMSLRLGKVRVSVNLAPRQLGVCGGLGTGSCAMSCHEGYTRICMHCLACLDSGDELGVLAARGDTRPRMRLDSAAMRSAGGGSDEIGIASVGGMQRPHVHPRTNPRRQNQGV